MQIISHCLIFVSLVVACSALVVSHPRCRNRCGGGSHLKILIQAHCPLMFPQNIFHSLCIERPMVFIMGSPSSVDDIPWSLHDTLDDMDDRLDNTDHYSSSLHPIVCMYLTNRLFSGFAFLCRIFLREKSSI